MEYYGRGLIDRTQKKREASVLWFTSSLCMNAVGVGGMTNHISQYDEFYTMVTVYITLLLLDIGLNGVLGKMT